MMASAPPRHGARYWVRPHCDHLAVLMVSHFYLSKEMDIPWYGNGIPRTNYLALIFRETLRISDAGILLDLF